MTAFRLLRRTGQTVIGAVRSALAPWLIIMAMVTGVAVALDRMFPPDLSRYHAVSPTVTDRNGRLLRAFLSEDEAWRFPVTVADVSPFYLEMLIAIEDRRFAWHSGVDPVAMIRAASQALVSGRVVSGASTLTMQVARLLEPRPRTIGSKLVEMARAMQLERRYSKDEILDIYLTLAPFGGNLEGVRAASTAWFGREPARLTPGEAALLVTLPQSPNAFRPDRNPRAATLRRNLMLERAHSHGILSEQRAIEAQSEPVPTERRSMPLIAGIATDRLLLSRETDEINTTISIGIQKSSETILAQAAEALGPSTGAAAIIADIDSGAIRALVGSADYLSPRRAGMVDQTRAVRSPGSALKPLIYAMAFDQLIAHPETVVSDRHRRFGAFSPVNFDRGWSGDVTMHDALRLSLNGPAVALLDAVGPAPFIDRLATVGAPLLLPESNTAPGLAIALGGVGTTLEDLVTLYAAIARGGTVLPLQLQDGASGGAVPPAPAQRLMSEVAAWYVARSLSATPRPLAYRPDGHGGGRLIAYKTGTSHGYRDGWAIGFSGDHVVGVWVGRPDGAPCPGCSGIGSAAPAMFRLFDLLPRDTRTPLAVSEAPQGAITGGYDALPVRLRRFDPDGGGNQMPGLTATAPPRFDFPADGAELLMAPALPLRIIGGLPPYRILIDGFPTGGPFHRGQTVWGPDGPGASVLTVVDANGQTAQSRVEILAP